MLKCEREGLNFWFMGAEVGERPYQGGLFIFDFINSDISQLDIDYILKYLILDISDIPHKVEIDGSTVSMALTSKPTSEKNLKIPTYYLFFEDISDIDTILYFQKYG